MGQPQSLPQNKREYIKRSYYDGSKDDEDSPAQINDDGMAIFEEEEHDDNGGVYRAEPEGASVKERSAGDNTENDAPPAQSTNTTAFMNSQRTTIINAFQDHYTLGTSSTSLRFRRRNLRILNDDHNSQLVLEERKNVDRVHDGNSAARTATVKRTSTTNFGMALLRTVLYTLPSLFIMTCTFAFGAQCILFLFMNIVAIQTPESWEENPPTISIVSAVVAVPVLLYSLGSAMTMSWALVVDCWRGLASSEQSLLRNMVFWDPMLTEWICLAVFAGVPVLALMITTLMRNDDWYEITIASSAIAALVFQTFYMLLAFLNEMHMCASLLKKHMPNIYDERQNIPKWMKLIEANVLLTQRQKYSGMRHERYLVNGNALPPRDGFSSDSRFFPVQYQLKLGSRLTLDGFLWGKCGNFNRHFFDVLEKPKRNFTMDEVFGNVMILSKGNWTLERIWCMDRKRSAAITLTEGKSSVSESQMMMGHVCIGVSVVLIVLTVAGFLTWTGQSPIAIFAIVVLVFCCCLFPIMLSSYQVYRFQSSARAKIHDDEARDLILTEKKEEEEGVPKEEAAGEIANTPSGDEEDPKLTSDDTGFNQKVSFHPDQQQPSQVNGEKLTNTAFISVWESVRISDMKPWFCWTTAVLEISIFFVWPFISLFSNKNMPIAIVFMVTGIPSVMRHYFNVTNLLQELGPIENLDLTSSELSPALCGLGGKGGSKEWWSSSLRFEQDRKLKNQALVATIVKRITRSRNTGAWIKLFFFLFFCVFTGFLLASTEESFDYKVKGVTFADGFYYEPQPNLPYPTCSVQKGFTFPGQNAAALADYSFLSTMSFAAPEEAQPLLNQWFGNGQVIDDYEFVAQYRNATGTDTHPVSYKLFTIPAIPDSAIVAIRGSESMWDWMVDIQLWCGGVLAQIIELVNPFGWIWEPILDDVVYVINRVQSKELKEVSYYRYTSAFVLDMYSGFGGRQYDQLRVTGASLGGGLAILTGAITGASAIALSGLNSMYSRHTFEPPITADQLNTRVFNTIPERDVIAHIDKPGMLVQNMQCRGPKNSLFGCHSMFRSLCEIQYQCGTNGRPVNCWCTSKYGYPVPTSNSSVTWEEACAGADD